VGELPDLADSSPSVEEATKRLRDEWAAVQNSTAIVSPEVPDDVRAAISRSINSTTKTYRYILTTQLLAKAVSNQVDCRALQASAPLKGAFDARTICHKVVVPFDRSAEGVLGNSDEPYVSKPARMPAIVQSARSAHKNKRGFDDLLLVLEFAQGNPKLSSDLLRLALAAILSRLATVRVVYPVPNRASQASTLSCIHDYLTERSGGARLQAVAVALFRAIGRLYGQFAEVESNNINAADASTGNAADLECLAADGRIVKAVEIKDRQLTLLHIQSKLPRLREKGITEAIFVVQGGSSLSDREQILSLIQKEFGSGQNLYVAEFMAFLDNHLIVFGEDGRRQFLQLVGRELDQRKADISHRQRWRDILAAI